MISLRWNGPCFWLFGVCMLFYPTWWILSVVAVNNYTLDILDILNRQLRGWENRKCLILHFSLDALVSYHDHVRMCVFSRVQANPRRELSSSSSLYFRECNYSVNELEKFWHIPWRGECHKWGFCFVAFVHHLQNDHLTPPPLFLSLPLLVVLFC